MENKIEIWKKIKGYEDYYEISNFAKVKSLERIAVNSKNRKLKTKFLKPSIRNGYYRICLFKDGTEFRYSLNRLVALHFVDNPNNLPFVNHLNGIKLDDRAINLEWCTASENTIHAYKTGLKIGLKGNKNPAVILTKEKVVNIRKKYKIMKNNNEKHIKQKLSKEFGVASMTIYAIVTRRLWNYEGI